MTVVYYVFDLMILSGIDVRREPLERRRLLLEKKVLPKLSEPVRYTATLDAPLLVLIESVKAQGLEGRWSRNGWTASPGRDSAQALGGKCA